MHAPVLAAALATAADQGVTAEHAEERLRDGAARWWLWARRSGRAATTEGAPMSTEEAERLRQLEWVRSALPDGKRAGPAGG
jgi:hypothetical protein